MQKIFNAWLKFSSKRFICMDLKQFSIYAKLRIYV